MKSWLLSLGSIALGGALLLSTGCSKEPEQYTVVFRQDGQQDITFTVQEGSDIAEFPTPKAVTGYTVSWDRTSLENITENIVVNAVVSANEYTITYAQEDGVTLDAYTQTVVYDSNYELKTPTKDLYNFDGWYNGTTLVAQSGVWNIASDVTLTAKWLGNGYTVKFVNLDGTEVDVELGEGEVLDASKIPAVQTKEGYDTKWSVTDFTNISTDTTVEAVATPKTYTITYALATGETMQGETTQTVVYDANYELKTPDKDLYRFDGWYNGTTLVAQSGDAWKIASDVTLTAKWVDNYYEIVFNNTDGTTETVKVENGATLSADRVPTCKEVAGYTVAWEVTDFSTITSGREVNAVKTANTYTITYALATGETMQGETTQAVVYDAQYELKTPIKELYNFDGWYNGTTLVAQSGDAWKIASDVTLTAHWSDNSYTVTFKQDGQEDITIRVEAGSDITDLPSPKAVTGYTVTWDRTTFENITENIVVNAVVKANEYTITYVLAAGQTIDGKTEFTEQVTYGEDYTLKTLDGEDALAYYWEMADGGWIPDTGKWDIANDVKLHVKWSQTIEIEFKYIDKEPVVVEARSGKSLAAEDIPELTEVEGYDVSWSVTEFIFTESTTVTEVRTPKTYTITYALATGETIEGETTQTVTQTVVYDANYELKTPTKSLYKFDGWYNGTTLVAQSDAWKIASDVTLTAKWVDNYYEIVFNNTDGTTETVKVENGATLSEDRVPTCKEVTGYTVAWEVTDFSTITTGREVNAVKKAKTYTITYKSAEGVTLPSELTVTVTYGEEYNLGTPTHSDRDLYFAGWKTDTDEKVKSKGVWKIDGDVTLVAVWIEKDSDNWTGNY